MAASAAPRGFLPVEDKNGGAYNGKLSHYPITTTYATSIYFGDVVKLAADGTLTKATTTTGATNANFGVGIFMGCEYTDPNSFQKLQRQYWPASTSATDAVAYVADSPAGMFKVQANGSLAQTALGTVVDLIQTSGSTVFGTSKVAVNAASSTDSTTGPFRIVAFVEGPDSAVGDAYTDLIVIWNETYNQYRGGIKTSI